MFVCLFMLIVDEPPSYETLQGFTEEPQSFSSREVPSVDSKIHSLKHEFSMNEPSLDSERVSISLPSSDITAASADLVSS